MPQVLSNAAYKSVEHRVTVSAAEERLSMAFFYNPRSDLPIAPMPELVAPGRPALYPEMTFDEYRVFIRQRGLAGKAQLRSLQASNKAANAPAQADASPTSSS
jgi:isopenicillin N synthase-like dioxygenase